MPIAHGVFLIIEGLGVPISGDSGIGKSELALDLISRGHQLVADDAPEFAIGDDHQLMGHCPPLLQDFLEIRGLGVINIRKLFGSTAIGGRHRLDLIIELGTSARSDGSEEQRLFGQTGTVQICERAIPTIKLNIFPGRSLPVLVETSVRNHLLVRNGYNSAVDFQARLQRLLDTTTAESEHDDTK